MNFVDKAKAEAELCRACKIGYYNPNQSDRADFLRKLTLKVDAISERKWDRLSDKAQERANALIMSAQKKGDLES